MINAVVEPFIGLSPLAHLIGNCLICGAVECNNAVRGGDAVVCGTKCEKLVFYCETCKFLTEKDKILWGNCFCCGVRKKFCPCCEQLCDGCKFKELYNRMQTPSSSDSETDPYYDPHVIVEGQFADVSESEDESSC